MLYGGGIHTELVSQAGQVMQVRYRDSSTCAVKAAGDPKKADEMIHPAAASSTEHTCTLAFQYLCRVWTCLHM
jgi:hypothetical protein